MREEINTSKKTVMDPGARKSGDDQEEDWKQAL